MIKFMIGVFCKFRTEISLFYLETHYCQHLDLSEKIYYEAISIQCCHSHTNITQISLDIFYKYSLAECLHDNVSNRFSVLARAFDTRCLWKLEELCVLRFKYSYNARFINDTRDLHIFESLLFNDI